MGTCFTSSGQYFSGQFLNDSINERLEDDYQMQRSKNLKFIILLGTKQSGKSTIFRQLQRIRDGKLIEPNDKYLNAIRQECLSTMVYLLGVVKDTKSIQSLQSLTLNNSNHLKQIGNIISTAWIKYNYFENILSHSYAYSDEYILNENIEYFMHNIDRIMSTDKQQQCDSILTDEDIIKHHTQNSNMNFYSYEYTSRDDSFEVIDFDMPNKKTFYLSSSPYHSNQAVIYVAALSDYCETLDSSDNMNAMQYAIDEFGIICGNKWFRKYEYILFLNKDDIFMSRLRSGISLSVCFGDKWQGSDFPDYEYNNNIEKVIGSWTEKAERDIGSFIPADIFKLISEFARNEIELIALDEQDIYFEECYEQAIKFIQHEFIDKNQVRNRVVFCHVMQATDKDTVEKVFWDVQNIMVRSYRRGGLMV